ncbi:hypothetical protein N7523_000366 [Penicillium sp. IBT 18751x]|nr:hypothetical protein N7523_000366 [Penicillium sp. IBT 18751x]
MQFKTLIALFALAGLGAAMPADENLEARNSESFCCTGIVVSGIVGLGCQPLRGSRCIGSGSKLLTCSNGAIVFPPSGSNSYVVCGKQ